MARDGRIAANGHLQDAAAGVRDDFAFAQFQLLGEADDERFVLATDRADELARNPQFDAGLGVDDLDFAPGACAQYP